MPSAGLSRGGLPVGLGFAVDREHVVTCAHVLNKAHQVDKSLPTRELEQADAPDTGVIMAAEFIIGSSPTTGPARDEAQLALTASLAPGGWLPSDPARFAADDVAVLRLSGPVPSFVPEVTTRLPISGDMVQVFGPVVGRPHGGHITGEVLGEIANGRVQINTGGQGFRVRPGFSGGPVWRRGTGEIVGMLVACGRGESDVDAYILDVTRIARVWPAWSAAGQRNHRSVSGHELGVEALAEALMALNPEEGAELIARLTPDDVARLLLKVPVSVAREAMEALIAEDKGLAVALLGHVRRSKARELIAAMTSLDALLKQLPEAADAIDTCHSGLRNLLGKKVGLLALASPSRRSTQGYYQSFQKGQIHWSAKGGAQATTGPIAQCHIGRGGSGSKLGFPLTPAMDAQQSPFKTDGKLQRFEFVRDYGPKLRERIGLALGATVYSSEKHGTHVAWGGIGEYYENNGGTGGPLGFPISDEITVGPSLRDEGPGTTGWCQRFEGGAVYYTKTGGVAVSTRVADYLDSNGGVSCRRGFPVSPEREAANSLYGTKGRMQRFAGGRDYPRDILNQWPTVDKPGGATVYTSDAYGTYTVGYGNGKLHERLGGTGSWLGFPISDSADGRTSRDEPRWTIQEFEGGTVFWTEKYRSVAVPRATIEHLSLHDGLREQLGLPIEQEIAIASADDRRMQLFEHGLVTSRNDTIEVWLRPEAYFRAVPLPEPGEDQQRISLVALNYSPETVACGEPISLEYVIEVLPDAPSPVVLGASLLAENGDDYFDKASDLQVDLTPGRASYLRPLVVPASVPAGRYRLIGAVWYPASGERRLAWIDHGFVVTVTAPITA